MENKFTKDDLQKLQEFGKFILERATWQLSTVDAMKLNKFLMFYNSLSQKVEANILEVVSMKPLRPDESTPEIVNKTKKPKVV